MKMLVVFDGSSQSGQNFKAALNDLREIDGVELKVAVLELLPEDAPLDDYLVKMERQSEKALAYVQRQLDLAGYPDATLEIWKGMEPEATRLVAGRAAEWGADRLYLPLGKTCFVCEEAARRKPGFWRRRKPARVEPVAQPGPVNSGLLSELLDCPLALTCHGETVLTFRIYQPKYGQVDRYSA